MIVAHFGSIARVTASSTEEEQWLRDNVDPGDYNPDFPAHIIVEPRYLAPLLEGAEAEGFTITGGFNAD